MNKRISCRIRKRIEIKSNIEYYTRDKYNIGIIVPITSNKRSYKNIRDIDFFKILFSSFLKNFKKEGGYNYSFYLGYDDDDEFFIFNKEKIIDRFKDLVFGFKKIEMKIFLYEIKNLKGNLGEIWSSLANYASAENDYIYQLGDNILFINSGWEDRFIGKLISQNNTGVVGPDDINSEKKLFTKSFVHVTHLKIFGSYYPKKLKNWYINDWIENIYGASVESDINVKNTGGIPKYDIEDNKKLFQKVLKETLSILKEYNEALKIKKIIYFKCSGEIWFVHENKRFVGSNRLIKYDYKINEKLDRLCLKEKIIEFYNINYKQEKGIFLSILIPTLFTRTKVFNELTDKLMKQIEENNLQDFIEIISHCDNKTIDLVRKRNNMLKTAEGKFITNLDDDDDVADTYVLDIYNSIKENEEADIISFNQHCNCDGEEFYINCGINFTPEVEGDRKGNIVYRYPWIWCAWKKDKLLDLDIVEEEKKYKNWEEDRYLLDKIIQSKNFNNEIKIDKVLHYYRYSSQKSECPVGK